MTLWSELKGALVGSYCTLDVLKISSVFEAYSECNPKIAERFKQVHVTLSKFNGTLIIGYRVFNVHEITSPFEATKQCVPEVDVRLGRVLDVIELSRKIRTIVNIL